MKRIADLHARKQLSIAKAKTDLRPNDKAATRKAPEPVASGAFTSHTYAGGATNRAYKLYVPDRRSERPRPLLMMLHGCQQTPDDFAAGTRMNELADVHGFLVAYPAQTSLANIASCWSWFKPLEQTRKGAEPSQLAGIVCEIAEAHDVDMESVFVAGLSSGAAMAVILGETYPEIFSAVGAHSGLPRGAAHNMLSAFFDMKLGNPFGMQLRVGPVQSRDRGAASNGVPTIVFHGDSDRTVAASNGEAIVQEALHSFPSGTQALEQQAALPTISMLGHDSTTTRYLDAEGCSRVENWAVHGGTHAWSGGSAQGSYTDPKSDDAASQTAATRRFKSDAAAQSALATTVKLSTLKAGNFDAVFYPGGHGPLWDLAEDAASIALIDAMTAAGKPVAAVCHAPGVLRHAKTPGGQSLLKGKNVTGFTNTEEEAAGLSKVVPFLVEDMLKEQGGQFSKMADWQPHVVVDGLLITGQNPASSEAAANALLATLGKA